MLSLNNLSSMILIIEAFLCVHRRWVTWILQSTIIQWQSLNIPNLVLDLASFPSLRSLGQLQVIAFSSKSIAASPSTTKILLASFTVVS